jgi:Tfp pilus assembly protein PilF
MRKTWFATCAAVGLAAGCAGQTNPMGSGDMAANGAAMSQPASWAERITAPFKKIPFAELGGKKSQRPKVALLEKPFDPQKATPELYVGLAQISHRNGDIPQARELYQKALARDPNHLDALLGAARMEDREGQLDVALMLYKRAAASHPQNATALNDLALCFARRGELATAHQVLEDAVRLEPQKPLYRNNVAKVLVELNGINPAMQHMLAVHPPAVANYNIAVLLAERSRTDESAHHLSQALAIDPQMEPARVMLAQQTTPTSSAVAGPAPIARPAGRSSGQRVADNRDSILPTPETVATIPWQPSADGRYSAYPTTAAPAETAAATPTAITTVSGQTPALLPPVNQSR